MTSGSVSTSLNSVEQTTDLSALMTLVFWNRFRNFEQLHRRLKDMPYYTLNLPPKRFLSSSLDNSFVRERCILLDKYLKVSVGTSILTGLDMYSLPAIFVDKRQKFVSMFLLNSYTVCSIEGWTCSCFCVLLFIWFEAPSFCSSLWFLLPTQCLLLCRAC